MITIGMNYRVKEGKGHAFEQMFRKVIDSFDQASGHVRSNLYKDIDDEMAYLIISEWQDNESYETFISSDAFKKVTNWGAANILAGPPKHKVYGD